MVLVSSGGMLRLLKLQMRVPHPQPKRLSGGDLVFEVRRLLFFCPLNTPAARSRPHEGPKIQVGVCQRGAHIRSTTSAGGAERAFAAAGASACRHNSPYSCFLRHIVSLCTSNIGTSATMPKMLGSGHLRRQKSRQQPYGAGASSLCITRPRNTSDQNKL